MGGPETGNNPTLQGGSVGKNTGSTASVVYDRLTAELSKPQDASDLATAEAAADEARPLRMS